MNRLDHRSSRILLSALEELNSDVNPLTLPRRAVAAAGKLIRADWLTFDFFSTSNEYQNTAWTDTPDVITPETTEPFRRLLHQHPIVGKALNNPDGRALKVTDAVSQSAFEKSAIFNEFFRKVYVDRQMGLALLSESDLIMTYAFSRKGRDFTESERTIASMAAPHFINAIRNGFAFGRLSAAVDGGGFGVIAIGQTGKTTFVSQFAFVLLERYFPSENRETNSLPESVAGWLRSTLLRSRLPECDLPAEPLRVKKAGRTLTIRLLDNRSTHEEILLLEEKKHLSPESFENLSTTKREAEILFWIAQGKSDADMSLLCDISIRTVQKHIENIYKKLGVENRRAAAQIAIDLTSNSSAM